LIIVIINMISINKYLLLLLVIVLLLLLMNI